MTRLRFEDAGFRNSYAKVCNGSSTCEEIVFNLGLHQAWERSQQDMQGQLTNRIILIPYAAKRLTLLLGAVMQQSETRFDSLDTGLRPADVNRNAPTDQP